jgi:predicted short-subunit dehydrogenase-like oxidoreductase (DUF2520 family)
MNKKNISIIGTGSLGSALARSFQETGRPVKSLFNRSSESIKNIAKELSVEITGTFPVGKPELGQLVFLTVPDQAIEETAERLAALDDDYSEYTVVHCSGTKTAGSLQSMREKGAETASFHPLQTFIDTSGPSDFRGITFDIEGQPEAVKLLKEIAAELGAHSMKISPEAKPYLHAAGVMASNYIVALLESAAQIAEMSGLNKEDAQKALKPLMQKSVMNMVENESLPDALSGPIARGDVSTAADHLKVLEQNPQLSLLYKKLGVVLVQLLEKNDGISDSDINDLLEILK